MMIRRRFLVALMIFAGALCAFATNNDVYAEEDSGGSFVIYATQIDCSYYDNNLIQDPCPSGVSRTAEIKLSDSGEYSIGRYNGVAKNKIGMRINGKQLVLEPSCSWFGNCSEITINLGENINDAYNAVNGALNGKIWTQKNDAVGSSYYTVTQYLFSADDVTDPTKAPEAPANTETQSTGSVEANCMNSGDLNTLGWILCPAMTLMGDAAEGLYNDAVKPALQVEPQLFTDGNAGAQQAWETFRNIANGVLIIFFLFIIFSQLTGVGIDNYGIKKALPKVIVAAVLMNLSFFLCEILVDLSNIFGNSLQALFNGLPVGTVPDNISGVDIGEIATGAGTTLLTGGVLAGALVGGIWAAGGGVATAVGLLVAVIGVVVSIFFLFIILSVRQAAIIVLAVISPIAIVCYMLPNTKNWFDKWWKFFGSLLLVYPIAGLLVGGGNFVSKLMLAIGGSDGGFFWAFTAMLASIVPIFFIPTVLRNSLNAAGQLGTKISGIGQKVGGRLSGGADKAIRGTNAFKSHQEGIERARQARSAQRVMNRYSGRDRSSLSARQQQRLLEAEQAVNAQTAQAAQAAVGAFPLDEELALSRAQSSKDSQEFKAYQDQFAGFDRAGLEAEANSASTWLQQPGGSQRMSALIGAMEANGMQSNIYSMLRSNNVSGMSGVMQALASSNDKVLKAYGKRGFNTDYNSFMSGSGSNSLKGYAAEKGADFVNGLDDKALAEINARDADSVAAGNGHIMSTDQLVQAASQLNSEDSMREVNAMLAQRNDIQGKISGEQLVNFNDSTVSALLGNTSGRDAMDAVTDAIANDPQLAGRLSASRKQTLNNAFRIPRGKSIIR